VGDAFVTVYLRSDSERTLDIIYQELEKLRLPNLFSNTYIPSYSSSLTLKGMMMNMVFNTLV
jgi:hypothetical protein